MADEEKVIVREAGPGDGEWIRSLLRQRWGDARLVSRGRVHQGDALPALVATLAGQEARSGLPQGPHGLATYRIEAGPEGAGCELVSLDSVVEGRGVGSALVRAVADAACRSRCRRLWLITTNDNLHALGFYQRRGFELVAVHRGALSESRRLKPGISLIGMDGIPLRDEIELEMLLERPVDPVVPTSDSLSEGRAR